MNYPKSLDQNPDDCFFSPELDTKNPAPKNKPADMTRKRIRKDEYFEEREPSLSST